MLGGSQSGLAVRYRKSIGSEDTKWFVVLPLNGTVRRISRMNDQPGASFRDVNQSESISPPGIQNTAFVDDGRRPSEYDEGMRVERNGK